MPHSKYSPPDRTDCVLLIVVAVPLLYRRIAAIGKISIVLWVVVLGTILWLIYGGGTHFNARATVLTLSRRGWSFSWIFFAAWATRSCRPIYSYLGYYNVCNLGGEMKDPQRNIPRAIFISIIRHQPCCISRMQTSILSVIPWQEAAKFPLTL